nr:putative glycoside hydrolase [Acidithiobacillus ferrooxidans]
MSSYGAANTRLRESALDIIGKTGLNAVVIDVKNDRGMIAYKTDVPLATEIGAQKVITIKHIQRLMDDLHQEGIYTIARIVVFKDNVLALARPDLAVRTAGGAIWRDREGLAWTDPFSRQVWDYNIDIAIEAAKAPDLNPRTPWRGYRGALGAIIAEKPVAAPGSRYLYSDINFEALGVIVQRISGESLDVYCAKHIFGPLGMLQTTFRPPAWERYRVAPTEYLGGRLRWGKVHDPTAYRMGGVSGHAGLFSTAGDLAIFAQMLLNGGALHDIRILDRRSVGQMTVPQSPPGKVRLRGLGWDLAAPFAPNRDDLLPVGAYDHTGFTGTLLWIDPVSRTYVIILTNRVYPFGKGNAGPLRKAVVQLLSSHLGPLTDAEVEASRPRLGRYYALVNRPDVGPSKVQTGMGGPRRHYVQQFSGNRPVSG